MSLFDALICVAMATFVIGWLVIILDAATGFGLIERIPQGISNTFGAIHRGAFIAIFVILSAGFIWHLATR